MRAGLTESVQYMEQKEMNTNIEYVDPFQLKFPWRGAANTEAGMNS